MLEGDQGLIDDAMRIARDEYVTEQIIYNSTFGGLSNGEQFGPFEEKAVEVAGIADRDNLSFEFAGWMAGLDPQVPEHRGIIGAAEHYYFNCNTEP